MSAFWDLNYTASTSPPKTPPPLNFSRSEFSYSSGMSSPMQDGHDNLDWKSSDQVEFTRLNPSRTRDSTGEWHMITATRSLLGNERECHREDSQARWSYNSLPRAHFLQPNRDSSAFSPYTNDFWSPRNTPELHPLVQPGFYSPKIQRSKHCDDALSTKNAIKGSSTSNMKEFNSHTLPLPCSRTAVLKHGPLCCKPQKVKTSVVQTPPLMRAVISQTPPNFDQSSKKNFNGLSNLQEPNLKLYRNDQSATWSSSHLSTKHAAQSQDLFTEILPTTNHLSINTHLFPERQHATDQLASLPKLSQERFSGIKSSQSDPDQTSPSQPQISLIQPDSSQKQTIDFRHHEDCDVGNNFKNHVKSQVEMNSKNVFGQPRMIASLREACSPRPIRKSTVLEDLKKLIVMDETEDDPQRDPVCKSSFQQKEAGLCASPLLSSPVNQSYPEPTPTHLSMQNTECWAMPEQTECEVLDQDPDPEPMPLPNTTCQLDWDSLVEAAQAYEIQRMATLLSQMSPASSRPGTPSQHHHSNPSYNEEDTDDIFIDFPDQLSHLEGMLRRLSSDLLKEKRDKVALLAEVLKLRISNQHLREESLCAVSQLHKIYEILKATPGGVD
nr:signal-induced proliferation-associated 1-like protein 1 isoform X3 [Misgurnus anguillicaudatus]